MNASGTNGARKPKRSESAALLLSLPGLTRSRACPTSALNVEIGNIRFRCNPVSPGRWLLDRPVKPGDDNTELGQSDNVWGSPRGLSRRPYPPCRQGDGAQII